MFFSGNCYHEKIKRSTAETDGGHSIQLVELTDRSSLNVEMLMERRDSTDSPPGGATYLHVTR